jgi:hypothetical protein
MLIIMKGKFYQYFIIYNSSKYTEIHHLRETGKNEKKKKKIINFFYNNDLYLFI